MYKSADSVNRRGMHYGKKNIFDLLTLPRSLMAQWLRRASQGLEIYCPDLEVMGSNSSRVKLSLHGNSV